MPGKKLIRFDWAMKRQLRSKANYDILEGFLSELLGEDLKILSLLESESNKENEKDKQNRVDVLIEDSKGQQILIEVQNDTEQDFMQRIHFGAAKLAVSSLDQGMPYRNIKKVIVVAIVFFDFAQGEDYIYKGTTQFVGINRQDTLQLSPTQQNLFQVSETYELFPEYFILKVNQFDDVAKSTLDEWMYFFKHEALPARFTAKGLARAAEELDVMKLSEEDRRQYDAYMEDLSYQASMYESMVVATRLEEQKKAEDQLHAVAHKLHEKGLPLDEISQITGLSIEELKGILGESRS